MHHCRDHFALDSSELAQAHYGSAIRGVRVLKAHAMQSGAWRRHKAANFSRVSLSIRCGAPLISDRTRVPCGSGGGTLRLLARRSQ